MTTKGTDAMALPKGITLGNVLSICATLVSLITIIVTMTLAYGELKSQDEKFALRIERLELRQKQSDADHDILIEIRQDLRILRQQVEAVLAAPSRRASNTDALRVP